MYDENQTGFHQEKFNGSTEIPTALADGLNNGKPLTLYFDGIASHLTPSGEVFVLHFFKFNHHRISITFFKNILIEFECFFLGSTYKFAKGGFLNFNWKYFPLNCNDSNNLIFHNIEWFTASESNICYMTYAYEIIPNNIVEVFSHARYMVKTHRLQFTAKLARDLVLSVRDQCLKDETPGCMKDMSQVTMLGFSFGAHIASQACRNLHTSTEQKVGKLIGNLSPQSDPY